MIHNPKHWRLFILALSLLSLRTLNAAAEEGAMSSVIQRQKFADPGEGISAGEYCTRLIGDFNGDGVEDYAVSKKQPDDYPLQAFILMGGKVDPADISAADLRQNPYVLALRGPFAAMFLCSLKPLVPNARKALDRAALEPLQAGASPVGRPTFYRLMELSTNEPYPYGYPVANHINAKGHCVGKFESHAFLYDHEIHDLGSLGGFNSEAYGVNHYGDVVGVSDVLEGEEGPTAFIYDGLQMESLGLGLSWANKINDKDQVVGGRQVANGETPTFHAFLYEAGRLTDIGTLGGTHSDAHGINGAGQVVGEAETILPGTNYPTTHAFIYENSRLKDLGVLGSVCFIPGDCYEHSAATDINVKGQIVGFSSTNTSSARAFVKDARSMREIGTAGGGSSWAYGINDSSQIVGTSLNAGETAYVPFLFDNGTMYNLYDLIIDFPTVPFPPFLAKDINNFGRIVGPYLILDPVYEQIAPNGEYIFDAVLASRLSFEYWVETPDNLQTSPVSAWIKLQVRVDIPEPGRWLAVDHWIPSRRWGIDWHRGALVVPNRLRGKTATIRIRAIQSGSSEAPTIFMRHFKMD